jgi:hypothetical protein
MRVTTERTAVTTARVDELLEKVEVTRDLFGGRWDDAPELLQTER